MKSAQFVGTGGVLRSFDLRAPKEGQFASFPVPEGTRFLGVEESDVGWLTLFGISPPEESVASFWRVIGVVPGGEVPPFCFHLGHFDDFAVFLQPSAE